MRTTKPMTSQENLSTGVDNSTLNALSPLGEKIFLDRYALKDGSKQSLAVGDTVIVCVDLKTGQREIGTVRSLSNGVVTVELRDGATMERAVEHVDKPLEIRPAQMMERVARGVAAVEAEDKRAEWEKKFRWLLDGWKFVPGGRILTAAGTEQQLTYYNCYVVPSPKDSRQGIVETLSQMMEIMSRGGGVGINVSSLRPRHSYVRGVNGRSSGAVSWGALYSFVTGLIEQGGCFGPDERILTNVGLIPAQELADRIEAGEPLYAHTHKGLRQVTACFRNGVKLLYEVTTRRGYKVRITADHKVAVLRDGKMTTLPLKHLVEGDEILLLLGEGVHSDYVSLKPVAYDRSVMSTTLNTDLRFPDALNEDLAYLLGYMHGDGYVHIGRKVTWEAPKAVKMATADAYPEIRQRLIHTVRTLFGLEPVVESGTGAVKSVCLYSRLLMEWLIQNGLLKAKADRVRVPEAIFRSPSSVMGAFIAGYFDADGCNRGRKGGYGIDSISRPLLEDLQRLLAINGIVSSISATDRSQQGWQTIYRLNVTGGTFKRRFTDFVSTMKASEDNGKRDMYQTYPAQVWNNLGARAKYRQRIYDGVSKRISFGQLTHIGERLANDGQVAVADALHETLRTIPDTIASIESIGASDVYDFEVDDVHLLSGNGIYTSNSRRGALMLICNVWHPDVLEFITSKREMGKITNANISVGITDTFMDAVKDDRDWDLVFPDVNDPDYNEVWDGDLEKWTSLGKSVVVHKTVRARDVWNAIIESAWASAEPGVWFMERANKMSNSFYYAPLVSTNPCGEQPLPAWSVCNLGAINLSQFAWDGQNVDWEALRKTVRYAVRFLDNVIDATPYFFEENEKQQKGERRVGLGTMGLAEMLIRLGICYGSEESVKFIDQLYKFIATEAYLASADYAAEKGSFPRFDAEKFLQSGFMKSLPEKMRQAVKEKGCRNVTLLTQAPTGCVAPDTLVSTATGLRPILELGDPTGDQWQPVNHVVHTDVGLRAASHFYVNGYSPVKTVTTKRGFHLTATPNHRIRILDAEGDYVWRRMDELQIGDLVVLKKSTLGEGETVPLTPVEQGNRALSDLPPTMIPELAELLGLYMGDGYTKRRGGIHIAVSQQDPDLLGHVQDLLRQVWGDRSISVGDRIGCWMVSLTGYYIPRFFEANGFAKPSGNNGEGAAGAFVPSKVLRAGKACVTAFLRGLFEADGCIHRGTITLSSTSPVLISQVQQALLGLGIVSTVREIPQVADKFGTRTMYELRILHRREAEKFVAEVGFISQRKRDKAADLGNIADRGDRIAVPALCEEFYAQSQGLPNSVRQEIIGRARCNGVLTQQFVKETVSAHAVLGDTRIAQLVAMDVFVDEVARLEDGFCNTYDLSVPDDETYIANGFVSHNTTGTMVGTSTGIEPFYFWIYYRKSRLGMHEEKVRVLQEWQEAHPDEPLPDFFVTAMDLTPEEHVRVEAAIQRWTDSSISKTCNVPQHYTVEQTRELYEFMYELGCKGGTIYRDKSRDEQVLHLKGEGDQEKKPIQKVRPRPYKRHGVTVSKATPVGTAHITMNDDDEGNPFEVFIEIGKAGSDIKAMSEAIGRLMSLVLRLASPVTPKERVQEIINQIRGIGGARHLGFGKERVMSLPDAVGQALEEHYDVHGSGNGSSLLDGEDDEATPANGRTRLPAADLCPQCGLATFVRSEGCHTCLSCGHSEC